MSAVRWGILATGGIATRFVTELPQAGNGVVTAVGSRSRDTAEAFAAKHDIPKAHGSWADLANDPEVDIIYVATPHSHHHEAALLCLRSGKPLLVEKAFTLDLAQAQDLVSVARERRLFLMEAMWTRTLPAIHKMLDLVADGAIGDVTLVDASFGLAARFEADHRLRNPLLGGGALLDLGVYPVHFAHLLLGPPRFTRAWAHLYPEGTDERTGIVLGYEDGAVASLYCGAGSDVRSASVVGTKGRIEFDYGFHNASSFTLHRDGSKEEFTAAPSSLHFQAAEAGRCLQAGLLESPMVPLQSTLDVMATLDAIRSQIGVVYPNMGREIK